MARVPRAEARLHASHLVHGRYGSRNVFVGVHDRSIDDKGRLALPAAFRSELGDRCYVSLDGEGCVTIREVSEFEAHARELIDQEKRGELTRTRRRAVAANVTLVAIDKQGRVTLDEKVRAHAGLLSSSSVKVAGMFDAVEVWKPERFETVQVEGDHEEPARVWADDTSSGNGTDQ